MEHVVHHHVDKLAHQKGRLNTLVAGMLQSKRAGSVMYGSPEEIESGGGHAAHGSHGVAHAHHQDHAQGQGHAHGHGHGRSHASGHGLSHGHHGAHGDDAHHDAHGHHAAGHHHDHHTNHNLNIANGHRGHSHDHGHSNAEADLQKGSHSLEEGSVTSVSIASKRSAPSGEFTCLISIFYGCCAGYVSLRSSLSAALLHTADNAVVWMQMVDDTNILLVGYLHGVVALWDLEKVTRLHDLPMHQFGPVLVAMRTRDFLKSAQQKQSAALSRFKRPLFTDAMFSSSGLSSSGPTAGATGIMGSAALPSQVAGEAVAPLPQPLVPRSGATTPRLSRVSSTAVAVAATTADRVSPSAKAKNDGRLSLRGSRAPSEDSAEDVRYALSTEALCDVHAMIRPVDVLFHHLGWRRFRCRSLTSLEGTGLLRQSC
jgi:hypothetical protein